MASRGSLNNFVYDTRQPAQSQIMRLIFACVACLSALLLALFIPVLGVYIAMFFVGWALVPTATVQYYFGPAISGFALVHSLNGSYLTIGIAAAPFFCLGAFCLVKSLWDRNSGLAAVGIASLGYLTLTVVAYFRL
jgi:hypothetical protein